MNGPIDPKGEREQPDGEPNAKPGPDQPTPAADGLGEEDGGEAADQTNEEHGCVDPVDQNAAKETNEHSAIETVVAAEQDTEDERGKGVGRNQPCSLGSEEGEDAAVAENEEDLRRRKLQVDDAEDEKETRISEKRLWLIDPELRHRGRDEEESKDKAAGRLRLLPAKNKEGEPGHECDEDRDPHPGGVLETAQHLIRGSSSPGFARGKPASDEAFSVQKFEHPYFLTEPPVLAGERCCW